MSYMNSCFSFASTTIDRCTHCEATTYLCGHLFLSMLHVRLIADKDGLYHTRE